MMFTLDIAGELPLERHWQASSESFKDTRHREGGLFCSAREGISEGLPRRQLSQDQDEAGGSKTETETPKRSPQPKAWRPYPLRFPKMLQVALERLSV
jgi:hypothetical protein